MTETLSIEGHTIPSTCLLAPISSVVTPGLHFVEGSKPFFLSMVVFARLWLMSLWILVFNTSRPLMYTNCKFLLLWPSLPMYPCTERWWPSCELLLTSHRDRAFILPNRCVNAPITELLLCVCSNLLPVSSSLTENEIWKKYLLYFNLYFVKDDINYTDVPEDTRYLWLMKFANQVNCHTTYFVNKNLCMGVWVRYGWDMVYGTLGCIRNIWYFNSGCMRQIWYFTLGCIREIWYMYFTLACLRDMIDR